MKTKFSNLLGALSDQALYSSPTFIWSFVGFLVVSNKNYAKFSLQSLLIGLFQAVIFAIIIIPKSRNLDDKFRSWNRKDSILIIVSIAFFSSIVCCIFNIIPYFVIVSIPLSIFDIYRRDSLGKGQSITLSLFVYCCTSLILAFFIFCRNDIFNGNIFIFLLWGLSCTLGIILLPKSIDEYSGHLIINKELRFIFPVLVGAFADVLIQRSGTIFLLHFGGDIVKIFDFMRNLGQIFIVSFAGIATYYMAGRMSRALFINSTLFIVVLSTLVLVIFQKWGGIVSKGLYLDIKTTAIYSIYISSQIIFSMYATILNKSDSPLIAASGRIIFCSLLYLIGYFIVNSANIYYELLAFGSVCLVVSTSFISKGVLKSENSIRNSNNWK